MMRVEPASAPTEPQTAASPSRAASRMARRAASPSLSVLARLHLTYLWRHGRILSIDRPTRFTELVQRRKLLDRDPRLPRLIDKLTVKLFVADRLGAEWVTPTIWAGPELPALPPVADVCVVKSRHGCGQMEVVGADPAYWAKARRTTCAWVRRPYGRWLDEWGYRDVPRGLLIEPFVGAPPALPIDYKLYVFHGRVAAIQVHLDRATRHRWALFDRNWRMLSSPATEDRIGPPSTLARMIEGAEVLGSDFDFVRIDFYDVGSVPRFGEMTFYPGSGLDRFDPPEMDLAFGELWRARPDCCNGSPRVGTTNM